MNKGLGVVFSAVMLLTVGCNKKADSAADGGSSASAATGGGTCPAGSTEAPGEGWCIKLPDGYKFEKKEGNEISFATPKWDRITIEHEKEYTFKNTPESFKSMTANKTPTSQGLLLGGKGGWALLDDGKVALGTVRINHPKGGMLTWSLSSDSKSGKVQSHLESVKTITFL